MNYALLGPIAITGFSVAFLHAALPTHWLPFVLAGRAHKWSHAKTLVVTTLAGGGHVLFTIALGAIVAWFGIAVDRWTEGVFPWLAGGVLIAFGCWYLRRQWRGQGHGHSHFTPEDAHDHDSGHEHHAHHEHHHNHNHLHLRPLSQRNSVARSDRAIVLGLLAALTFSPCEGFLPMFVAGVPYGWSGFLLLSLLLAAATLAGMLLFTWLTLRGLEHLRLERLERYENGVVGALLCVLGIAIWMLET